jgi:vesicle transport protein SEC22
MIDNGICYLTLTDKIYPKRLVFLFLEEVAKEFVDSLRTEHGDENWRHCVETVGRQYAYIKFDRVIQKKRREFADPNSNINSKKINDDLQSIHTIMRKTIDDVLDRGNKLDGKPSGQSTSHALHCIAVPKVHCLITPLLLHVCL